MQPTAPWATSRLRSGGEELVHRAALVGLDVAERDPTEALHRHDLRNRFRDEREHRPRSGVEQERLVRLDDELHTN